MTTNTHSRHRRFYTVVLCVLCLFVGLSFVAPLLPIATATSGSSSMPCCAGKAGHCDSGLKAKKVPPPKSEPMCGLHGAKMESDRITIVAEPAAESHHSHSHSAKTSSNGAETSPAVESPSLGQPCHQECGACAAASTRQQKRERGIVSPAVFQNVSLTTYSRYQIESVVFSSTEIWSRISPRGPPARR